jgi:hypothetical protein
MLERNISKKKVDSHKIQKLITNAMLERNIRKNKIKNM